MPGRAANPAVDSNPEAASASSAVSSMVLLSPLAEYVRNARRQLTITKYPYLGDAPVGGAATRNHRPLLGAAVGNLEGVWCLATSSTHGSNTEVDMHQVHEGSGCGRSARADVHRLGRRCWELAGPWRFGRLPDGVCKALLGEVEVSARSVTLDPDQRPWLDEPGDGLASSWRGWRRWSSWRRGRTPS